MNNPNIIKLDPSDKEQIKAVSNLHSILLPESIVSKLGHIFLSEFYYKILTKNKLIDVYLYKINSDYVGFIACTDYPFTFMKNGVKRNFLRLSIILIFSILLVPSRYRLLLKMKDDVNLDDLKKERVESIGQFMSFGVLEEYRKHLDEFTNLSIANVLMRKVFSHFTKRKMNIFFLLVLKTNKNAIAFYKKYNGTIIVNSISKSEIVKFDLPANFELL